MHSFTTLRNSQHLRSTNVLAILKIILRFHLRLLAETKYQLTLRPVPRFATVRQTKSAASFHDSEKQHSRRHSWRRRLCVWISLSVSFVFTHRKILSSKVSVIMITRHKWLRQCQAQSVKFDHNIWVIPNLRPEGRKDNSQTLSNPPRPKSQVYWKKMMKTPTITHIWATSWKATFTEDKKKSATIRWNLLKTMMLTLRFPRRTNIAISWLKKPH